MGLGTDTGWGEGAVGGWWIEGGGGEREEGKDKGEEMQLSTAMKKAADEETGTAAAGKSQIACHQPTTHWSV